MENIIKEIKSETDMHISADIISQAYKCIAIEFNLTKDNCPTHAAFMTVQRLKGMRAKGVKLFGLFVGEKQIGFISTEKASDEIFYIMKLAVLPEYRGKSYGKKLMDFAFNEIKEADGKIISIGIIDENEKRKSWYKDLGFIEVKKEKYSHLPFMVCYMEKNL